MLLDALLDQVSLHVADSGDRSSEAKRAKLEEIDEEPAEANRAHLGPGFARWWLAAGSLLASAIADLARQVRPRGRATGLTAGGAERVTDDEATLKPLFVCFRAVADAIEDGEYSRCLGRAWLLVVWHVGRTDDPCEPL